MPNEVFNDLRKNYKRHPVRHKNLIDWINAYLSLTPTQKDFLKISKGFPKDDQGKRKPFNHEVQNLFNNVTANNLNKLEIGFKFPDFKNEYAKFYESNERVNKKTLKDRLLSTDPKEFSEILNKISQLI